MTATDTYRNSPASTGELQDTPHARPERDGDGPEVSSLQSAAVALRNRLLGLLDGARAYWVPPALLTEPPAPLDRLAAYAYRGAWTRKTGGAVRTFGIWWYRIIAVPTTVVCRYTEWVAQRPGRVLPLLLLWKLFATTGPGPWLVTYLIHPILGAIAWVLL